VTPPVRLYLDDPYQREFDAEVIESAGGWSTGEIGRARIVKFDNKGKDNKRFYWEAIGPRLS
jgi:Ser-tRNA(Ala) deacylase AlaX